MRLLLVEDEIQMAEALRVALARYDMVVDHVTNLESAENAVDDHVHDAIVLDRQLANEDGLNLLRYLRKKSFNIPVIVVTARSAMEERVAGLDQGADDYLGKPFAVEELVARLRALLRRPPVIAPLILNVGDLVYLPGDREARVLGQTLELPRRELLVLETLMRRKVRTVLRRVLEEAVYSIDDEIHFNALDSHISRLRKKLSEAKAGVQIHGLSGVGCLLPAEP